MGIKYKISAVQIIPDCISLKIYHRTPPNDCSAKIFEPFFEREKLSHLS